MLSCTIGSSRNRRLGLRLNKRPLEVCINSSYVTVRCHDALRYIEYQMSRRTSRYWRCIYIVKRCHGMTCKKYLQSSIHGKIIELKWEDAEMKSVAQCRNSFLAFKCCVTKIRDENIYHIQQLVGLFTPSDWDDAPLPQGTLEVVELQRI